MRFSLPLPVLLAVALALMPRVLGAASEVEAIAGDIDMGAALYKEDCRACHGPTAKGLSSYPKLRGQSVEYLVDRLERYRAGEKFGPNTPLMAPRAKTLSDDDIVNISTFIVSLE